MRKTLLVSLLAASITVMPITVYAEGELTVTQKVVINYPESSSASFFAKVENTGDAPIAFDEGKLVVFSDNDDILSSREYINTLPYDMILDAGEYMYVRESMYESAFEGAVIGDVKFSVQTKESEKGVGITRIPAEATYEIEGVDSYNNYAYITFTNETDEILYDCYVTVALLDAEGNVLFVDRNCYETLGVHPNSTVTLKAYIDQDLCEYYDVNGLTPVRADAVVCIVNE